MRNILNGLKILCCTIATFAAIGLHAEPVILHEERSLYRNIIVFENNGLRCLKFDERSSRLNQSCMYIDDPQKLFFSVSRLQFSALLTIDDPKKVLIIGLGGGTMSNALHQLYPDIEIDNVEIDPAVVKVARDYFDFYESDKITSHTQDGRIFVKRALLKKKQYDWIMLDAYNGDYIPEHLLTREFLEEVKALLAPNGILAANTFTSSKLYAYESSTYQSVFGHYYNVRFDTSDNRIILTKNWSEAGTDDFLSPLGQQAIEARIAQLQPKVTPLGVDLTQLNNLLESTQHTQDWPKDTKVLTDQFSPANLLNN
ncbi:fused MFS/spermidine synthase [Vibrio sp. SCSIO 43136]|uniref:spermidine synthase n=1 Tax=Vibrio sp. SCSIO 43136 TaxID=2819101 RepID=UPI0020753582|nr:fused MFS/spermidine synthase [Vibrio sp. SCSIO 43136]USD68031.1 fused MFS/spermidine synthase [Vibrio sp. SCSIO 43136]